jgi:hypothetical protein
MFGFYLVIGVFLYALFVSSTINAASVWLWFWVLLWPIPAALILFVTGLALAFFLCLVVLL